MKRVVVVALVSFLFLLLPAFAQVRPFVSVGGSGNGNGYSTISAAGKIGVDIESPHFVSVSDALYDTARKVDDNEIRNEKGHDLNGSTREFFKVGTYLVGGGMEWTKTITSDYTKEATLPMLGGGKDFSKARILVLYQREYNEIVHYPELVTFTGPGGKFAYKSQSCNCASGTQGFYTQFWYPSPTVHRHLFFRADLGAYWFHSTLTDPNNNALSKAEKANKEFGGSITYSVLWRF